MKKILILLLIFVLLISACNYKKTNIVNTSGYLTKYKEVYKLDPDIVKSLNSFGFNLYKELFKSGQNTFISPSSIFLALGMTYNGASNSTSNEIAEVLDISNLSLEDFNEMTKNLQISMLNNNIKIANSIWIRDTYQDKVKENFIEKDKEYYGAKITSLNFDDSNSIDIINNWVKKNTKDKIEKVIEENKINPLTVMYLINTIYFKADWKYPFKKENTSTQIFKSTKGNINVDMMNQVETMGYVENEDLQGILKSYDDNNMAMFVILPKSNLEILDLEKNTIINLINQMKKNNVQVDLSLPKVKIDYASKLNDSLIELGMIEAFNPYSADFSNMADNAIEDGLHISDITHKTFLKIDEKGTEAAAATKVEMKLESLPIVEYKVNVDHPFIVGIIDKESNAILFIGAIYNPNK